MTINKKFIQLCEEESDINEHLPTLRDYALSCDHITEMGVRQCISTYAFLAAIPKVYVGYDLSEYPEVSEAKQLAKDAGIDFRFIKANVLDVEIEQTDLLFIDTFHTFKQLQAELKLHSGKVNRYIILHDTETYWERGEASYESVASFGTNCQEGLRYAVEEFLNENQNWKIVYSTRNNNGLMILRRMS